MIEFRAECGHAVRAKDRDAGRVVACPYCGKETSVPDEHDDGLDFLFQEVERSAEHPAIQEKPGRSWAKPGSAKRKRATRDFNPFAIILKMIYAAALIIIVVVVIQKFVVPLFQPEDRSRPVASSSPERPTPVVEQEPSNPEAVGSSDRPKREDREKRMRGGLVGGMEGERGLYVSSMPANALVFYIPESKVSSELGLHDRIIRLKGCQRTETNVQLPYITPATYVVEVQVQWNHASLSKYPDYAEFRRSIQHAPDVDCRRRVEQYFLPDRADEVLVDKTEGQVLVVRRYRGVEVRENHWTTVHAVFLPKVMMKGGPGFDIQSITGHLPRRESFMFDVEHVNAELVYYRVPASQHDAVREVLEKIGTAPCMTPDRRIHVFEIGVEDGVFREWLIGRG